MRTIRRFYFYLVAFISLEVVVWGAISLARTLFENLPGGNSNQLATGLSLVLVGAPIFLLHWLIAQRDARRDEEEHASRLRAVFLYGARLATLIPVVQNVLALINPPLLSLLGVSPNLALIGATQSVWDNLAAIAINLVAWAYFERTLPRRLAGGLFRGCRQPAGGRSPPVPFHLASLQPGLRDYRRGAAPALSLR